MSNNIELSLIQFANYVRPKEYEDTFQDWVLNGRKNELYQKIIDCNDGSPTLGSINKSYADLMLGRGLSFRPTIGGSTKEAQDWARLKSILKDSDLKNMITDFQVFGASSLEVRTSNANGLLEISHLPKNEVVPSVKDEDGLIKYYWHSQDWKDRYNQENIPVKYPAFGTNSRSGLEIQVIRPYHVGIDYFETPDWISGLQYAESEYEIANLYANTIKNGLSTSFIINVRNGINLTSEEKAEFKKSIEKKLTGTSQGGNFIISLNGSDVEVDVVPFPTNDNVHKQWETLNEVCSQKILTAARCPSPSIVGIISSSGFSNTAEEMDMAESQLYKRVIQPKQKEFLSGLKEILVAYDINLDLYFLPLTEEVKQPTSQGLELSTEKKKLSDIEKLELSDILERYAEDPPEGYELDSTELVSLSAIQNSEQDTDIWKIRYAYVEGTNKIPKGKSRFFCTKMRSLEQAGKVYRKEDIIQMGNDGVNGQFAHSGGKYSIWLYGGGVNCYHRWERRIFKKKLQPDGKPFIGNPMQNVNAVNVNEARRQGAKIPKNAKDVAIAEIDKPNKGSLK